MDWFPRFESLLLFLYEQYWTELLAVVGVVIPILISAHIALNKRDSRSASGWIVIIWLVPVVGPFLYFIFGINRIQRRARSLTGKSGIDDLTWLGQQGEQPDENNLRTLAALLDRITGLPLTGGNDMQLLDAPRALDSMLAEIDASQHRIYLSTYIFDNDLAGKKFVDALGRAVRRGVIVRVLIDGVGSLYSFPSVVSRLRKQGVMVERFLFSFAPWRMPYLNLRNHRKLLICDDNIGFTGGMNIRQGYLPEQDLIRDMQVRIQGPVVEHLLRIFIADWYFVCQEVLTSELDSQNFSSSGDILARGISAGPDADLDKRRWTLLGAVGRAQKTVRIVTPYFVPDQSLLDALELAAMRGVQVDIVLPRVNNLRVVHWASQHVFTRLIRAGCCIYQSEPPFDHSKLMTVDHAWSLFGSGNWDARSLRLNFEFDVECYSQEFVDSADQWIDEKIAQSRTVKNGEVHYRPLWKRLISALAYLFEPYL